MRVFPAAAAALGCALALAACARIHVERAASPQPATVQTVPGATIITPAGTPPPTLLFR